MSRYSDLIAEVPVHIPSPQTSADAVQNLRHTLAVFDHPAGGGPVDRDRFVVEASRGYTTSPTGLTWQDLHLINEALQRLEGLDHVNATVPPPSAATSATTDEPECEDLHTTYGEDGTALVPRDHWGRGCPAEVPVSDGAPTYATGGYVGTVGTNAGRPGVIHGARTSGPLDPEIHAALVRSVERGRGHAGGVCRLPACGCDGTAGAHP